MNHGFPLTLSMVSENSVSRNNHAPKPGPDDCFGEVLKFNISTLHLNTDVTVNRECECESDKEVAHVEFCLLFIIQFRVGCSRQQNVFLFLQFMLEQFTLGMLKVLSSSQLGSILLILKTPDDCVYTLVYHCSLY